MVSLLHALPGVFIPLTVVIAITSFFGILGNLLALYVFSFRFAPSGFNTLMAALAAYDVIACLFHMPLDIATFFEVGNIRTYLCKITCFQLAFTATGSALVLLGIAVVRFYGVQKPLLGQVSPKSAYYVILVSILVAIGLGLPITILFGAGELQTDANITAEICMVEHKFVDTKGPLAYYFILASLFIITFIAHSCLYAKAMHTLWNRRRVFVSMRGRNNVVMLSPAPQRENKRFPGRPASRVEAIKALTPSRSRANSSSSQKSLFPNKTGSSERMPAASTPQNDNINNDSELGAVALVNLNDPVPNTEKGEPQPTRHFLATQDRTSSGRPVKTSSMASTASRTNTMNSRKAPAHQTSYKVLGMVIAVSMTYFLSYAPHFGVMFYLFTHDMSVFRASAQNLAFELLMRSFFLNNILDPVIYGLLSTEFRKECLKICKNLCKLCRRF